MYAERSIVLKLIPKGYIFSIISLMIVSVILSFWPPYNLMTVSNRRFTYGMALLVLTAAIFLLGGKFGFSVVRGYHLLFKGTASSLDRSDGRERHGTLNPQSSKPRRTSKYATGLMLPVLCAGLMNVLLSIILMQLVI